MSDLPICTPDELGAFAATGALPASALEAPYCVLIALDAPAGVSPTVLDWVEQLPCPSIGVGTAIPGNALAASCDVIAENPLAAAALAESIAQTPLAASVLVQTLRLTESLPVEAALRAESLAYATLQNGAEFRHWLATRRPQPRPPEDSGPAVLLDRSGSELHLQLNRPRNLNSMSIRMRDALVEALQLVRYDPSIERVRIDALGRCFSTGGEVTEFGSAPDPATAHAIRQLALPGRELWHCADRVTVRLHGACIGSGIEFPAFAGRIEAHRDTFIQLPELRYGLIPGAGGCVSISRRIGRQRCAWLALSGRRLKAREALEWGLIDELID
jgi:enoyl-CoA hydratase/carnithine racemase